jgi:predicted TIM-barrel fold metal-dependent hydrolase
MRRREFVMGAAAATAANAVTSDWSLAQSGSPPQIDRIIDAHCHVFNANDLPVEGFIKKIIVPRYARNNQMLGRFQGYPGALQALVHALAVQMKSSAPNGQVERTKLDEVDADTSKLPTPAWRREEDIKNVQHTFRRIWADRNTFRKLSMGQVIPLEIAIENIQLFLVREVAPQFGRPHLTADDRTTLKNWDYEKLAVQLYERAGNVGRYIRWALLFTRYRSELIDNLDQVHQLSRKSRVVLMTPAGVDFSKWVEDDDHSTIEQQIITMARLARRKTGPHIHGFVGFDPLRQALYERGKFKPGEKEPMLLLRAAIEMTGNNAGEIANWAGGAIGVKLYPPMGFRARNNAELDDAEFSQPSYLKTNEIGLGGQIGVKLDQALSKLYGWCTDKNVPIMAHTNNSFGPTPDYEDRAHPKFWSKVVDANSFPKLRVNLSHFGHFNEAVMHADPAQHVDKCWEWKIGELMSASRDSYVYADISSIAEILDPAPSAKIRKCMMAFKEHFKDSAERLIYGTDWSMIAQAEKFPRLFSPQPFPDRMVKFLHDVGYDRSEIEGIMFRNATRFLGLSKSERNQHGDNCARARLEKFYAFHRLPVDWMTALD